MSHCFLQRGGLVVRTYGSAEATSSVLGARRAGISTTSPCSEHLARLSRKSQEREGSCADQSNIEARWLDWATSQKANPTKPTAAQSISGDEATENDSQKYGEGVCRFHALTHLSEPIRTFFPKSSGFPTPFPTPKGCGRSRTSTNDSEQPIARWKSVWRISSRAQSGRFRRAQKKAEHRSVPCLWRVLLVFRSPTRRGHLDAMRSAIHLVTSCSFQTTVREPNWICLGKVPSLMRS